MYRDAAVLPPSVLCSFVEIAVMLPITRWGLIAGMFAGWLLCAGPGYAIVTPVKDDGKFFSEAATKRANDTIREIEHAHRKDLVIETMDKGPAGVESKARGTERDQFF